MKIIVFCFVPNFLFVLIPASLNPTVDFHSSRWSAEVRTFACPFSPGLESINYFPWPLCGTQCVKL